MVTKETTIKISKWLVKEIEKFIGKNKKNQTNFPSKRNFIDRAVMKLLEKEGEDLTKK